MSGPEKPREGPRDAPPVQGTEGRGLATALAAIRARAPRPSPSRRRPRTTWVAVGAAVVALILLAALLVGAFAGSRFTVPGISGGGGTAPSPPVLSSFYGALPAANSAARALYWAWPTNGEPPLVFAEGLAPHVALGALANASHLGTFPCAPTILSTTVPPLPSASGPLSGGLAPAWLFAFNPSGFTLLVLAVVNGTATPVATTVSNGACYNGPGAFSTVVVDSSVAASAAGTTSKSKSFFQAATENGTDISAQFLLVPPGYLAHTPFAPMWVVNDTTCLLYGGPDVLGTTLSSVVNAATGALYSQASVTVDC